MTATALTAGRSRRRMVPPVWLVAVLAGLGLAVSFELNVAQHHRLVQLEHACVPVDTGGGVTQCAQPTILDTALRACLRNDAYIGVTTEDDRHLLAQCLDDYDGMVMSR